VRMMAIALLLAFGIETATSQDGGRVTSAAEKNLRPQSRSSQFSDGSSSGYPHLTGPMEQ
jgi:hypothetical protein